MGLPALRFLQRCDFFSVAIFAALRFLKRMRVLGCVRFLRAASSRYDALNGFNARQASTYAG